MSEGSQAKFRKVMREFKAGKLHHGGTGEIVKRREVALAIAASESGMPKQGKRRNEKLGKSRKV